MPPIKLITEQNRISRIKVHNNFFDEYGSFGEEYR
jgi:hypothetical protein